MNEFVTKRLPLANYLIASKRLKFSRLEPDRRYPNRFQIVFEDPHGDGQIAESEFNSGALVEARAFVSAQTWLRRTMTEQQHSQSTSKFEENINESQPSR